MKNVHMICNAHLDPVWLWRWEEGCTEALSTFRAALSLTEQFPGFIFNHNEALLYKWVRENDPLLFESIQEKVKQGSWHIMGGWHLQPDCNMPNGESFIRNIRSGRAFFKEAFNVSPTTAINFDSFGHSRGLVQILCQSGYDSYLVCRPAAHQYPFESQDFHWIGLDGSSILVHRSDENYNSVWGHAAEELPNFLSKKASEKVTLWLWGVGDHGGGPSRKDLSDLQQLTHSLAQPKVSQSQPDTSQPTAIQPALSQSADTQPHQLLHSTPEAYFKELLSTSPELPVYANGLNPVAPGCYTSQVRVKQKHRQLENELYATEKMASAAWLAGLKPYNPRPLEIAEQDLLFSEFHDALPGSGSKYVEEDTLRQIEHGLQELSEEKLKIFLALSAGQAPVEDETSVVLVYNPHPFSVSGITEIEFGTPKQNWKTDFLYPEVSINGHSVPTQAEKESSDFAIDWRKKAAVVATLPPFTMTRMDVHFRREPARPVYPALPVHESYVFDNGALRIVINPKTGLIDEYAVDGQTYCKPGSFQLIVQDDTYNSWGIAPCDLQGKNAFSLLSAHEGSALSALIDTIAPSVRMIEDGEVRTVVEALFGYGNSYAVQRYSLPKHGTAFDVETRLYWNEKDRYVKLRIETALSDSEYWGQIVFGREKLAGKGEEVVAQKWTAVKNDTHMLSVLNDGIYGSNAANGVIGLTLLRSAGYAAGDCNGKALREIRFSPRMDQGEHTYRFQIDAGSVSTHFSALDAKASAFNEKPYAVAYCPPGRGETPPPALTIDNHAIQLSCMKQANDGNGMIIRLYESTGEPGETKIELCGGKFIKQLSFRPFEIKTFRFIAKTLVFEESPMLEGV